VLNKLKSPYNINSLTQQLVADSLKNITEKDDMVSQILKDKQILTDELIDLPVVKKVFPSDANFLLVQVINAKAAYRHLISDKIIVRDRSKVILCDECLRISVGNAEENKALIESMKAFSNIL
jgi:histidinol-phosphate aminotransferase